MAKFLNTSKATAEIEDIVSKAKKGVVLISPYIKLSAPFLERLQYTDKKNIKITVVCREEELSSEVKSDLKQINNLELCFLKNLHAKCFYNEESMVITSLNLYDYSQQNNREMGILVSIKDDPEVFLEAKSEADFIVDSASVNKKSKIKDVIEASNTILKEVNKFFNTDLDIGNKSKTAIKKAGHCIRCGKSIPQNIEKPYCLGCFGAWEEWENPDYKESYCHTCGKQTTTTMNKPLCRTCYQRS
jgi:hypothetical protein